MGKRNSVPPELNVRAWWAKQEAAGYPTLRVGDIVMSRSHKLLGNLIAGFQGRHGSKYSHLSIYAGGGQIIEATMPHGGVASLGKYLDLDHSVDVFRMPEHLWDTRTRYAVVAQMAQRAPRKYDKLNIARHLVDNLFERLGFGRPLAKLVRDKDADLRNVCTEAFGWSVWHAWRRRFCPNVVPGQERPLDIELQLPLYTAPQVLQVVHGAVYYAAQPSNPV